MKLLILTQKVNKDDDVLGFFHGWVEVFAKECEKITVICLEKGSFDLPDNVKIFSLGKESGCNKLKYLFRFYKYLWNERKNYDAVFVHMNQEYVLLGGLLWRILGKKILLWRNHRYGNLLTRLAVLLSDWVLFTSPSSFVMNLVEAKKKAKKMPVGINTEKFKRSNIVKKTQSILSLGRISPVKRLDILIETVNDMNNISLDVVGAPTEVDENYFKLLKNKARPHIKFLGSVKNDDTIDLYNSYELFVNLTPSGSFDKTILEAMACESLVLVSTKTGFFFQYDNFSFDRSDSLSLAKKINDILNLTKQEKENFGKQFREHVVKNHSLEKLVYEVIKLL